MIRNCQITDNEAIQRLNKKELGITILLIKLLRI